MKHVNIPVFIPHSGCPHQCIFCNQNKITGQDKPMTPSAARQEIERYLSFLSYPAEEIEIAFFGGSFTAIAPSEQEAYLALAQEYVLQGKAGGIRLSTRPDAVGDDVLRRLQAYGVTTVELGVQSFSEEVLRRAGRGHSAECVKNACRRVKSAGFSLGVQLMCGLPGDSRESCLRSAREAVLCKADFVRIYPVLVLAETPLAEQYRRGEYCPLSLEEAVERAADMTQALSPVPVIRTGLCTDSLLPGELIAGPSHPAFGELVSSRLWRRSVSSFLEGQSTGGKELWISAPVSAFSQLAGQKKENRKFWKKTYGLREVRFFPGEKTEFVLKEV